MARRLKPDALLALADWKAGKPVKSLELGHVHRMEEIPGFSPRIDASKHLHQDQDRAHAYCFHIIESIFGSELPFPEDFDAFRLLCDALEEKFRAANEGLTPEEIDGAESLAWKAIRFGWARAIEGHKDSMYITVSNPAVVPAT